MQNLPDDKGYFEIFGGKYVPETIMFALKEIENAYKKFSKQKSFKKELEYYLKNYVGRPTPLYYASRITKKLGGAKIFLKREDLNHTGAHKINNTIGQILLAKKIGKRRIIAETGAGQHGVATATACSLLGLKCIIYMGKKDMVRQEMNVLRMKLLGAEVRTVNSGSKTLKDAINEAIRDWVTNVNTTYYCIGSVVGPHPYPQMVRNFQSIIGKETEEQIIQENGKLPDILIACVGGGSNSIGLFYKFLEYKNVKIFGVEAGGRGINTKKHSASLYKGKIGVLHGAKTFLLQDKNGQVLPTHSISAGLDYPAVGPELSYLKKISRIKIVNINDDKALNAFKLLSEYEGIIPALESSHALAYSFKIASKFTLNQTIIVNLSGRGDKDLSIVEKYYENSKKIH